MSGPEHLDPHEIARLREAFASLADQPDQPRWPPADAERIFTALHGDMDPEARRAIVEELARYPDAAALWRLARDLTPEPTVAGARAPVAAAETTEHVAPGYRWNRPWTWASVAAVLLITAAGLWQLQSDRFARPPAYRSAESAIESLTPPDTPLPRAQPVLRWTPMAGARYRIRVLTPTLDVLDEADEIRVPEYRLRPEVLRRIASGAEILWQVDAMVPGSAAASSPTFSVRVE